MRMTDSRPTIETVLAENRSTRHSGASQGSLFHVGSALFKAAHINFPGRQISKDVRYAVVLVDSLRDDNASHVYVAAERGYDRPVYGSVVPAERTMSGIAIQSGEPVFFANAEEAGDHFYELQEDRRTASALAIPLFTPEGNTFGALTIEGIKGEQGEFGREIIEPMRQVAGLGALAIFYFSQATLDSTTGLYSRRRLNQELVQRVGEAERRHQDLSLVMLDVDNFKAFNDTHGHLAGDEVLRFVGDTITAHFPDRFAGRYGGEEYIVILPKPLGDALDNAELFRRKLERDSEKMGYDGSITASIGVASIDQIDLWMEYLGLSDGKMDSRARAGKLVDIADSAMYVGKGKDVHFWEDTVWTPESLAAKKNRVVHWVAPPAQLPLIPTPDTYTRMVRRGKPPREIFFRVHEI